MRILLAHYRYFVSCGAGRYMFNVSDALLGRGHEVIPFSVNYTRNQPTPYSKYFVEPLGSRDEVYFRDQHLNPRTVWRTMSRLFYARDVERAVTRIVADTQPQVAYVLLYLRKLSPSLLVGLKKAGLPIVVRLSDFGLLCPGSHQLRAGIPCELCTRRNPWPSVRHRCVQGSLAASALNALAETYHNLRRYSDLIDAFVVTNQFYLRRLVAAGIPEARLHCIPTFVDSAAFAPAAGFAKDGYIAYVGRLVETKGVHVLLEAMAMLQKRGQLRGMTLKLAGRGDDEYVGMLREKVRCAGLEGAVQFLGDLERRQVVSLLSRAELTVVPSLWYENLPNSLLESYACGTPVLASNQGSLAECVRNGETGYLFPAGDAAALAERLRHCLDHPDLMAQMARHARQAAVDTYGVERHISTLEALLSGLVAARQVQARTEAVAVAAMRPPHEVGIS